MIVKLLTEHHMEFLSLKGGCRGSSESTLAQVSNCWKSHAVAHIIIALIRLVFDLSYALEDCLLQAFIFWEPS